MLGKIIIIIFVEIISHLTSILSKKIVLLNNFAVIYGKIFKLTSVHSPYG